MNNGRDCEHGRRVGNCDSCDLAQAEKRIAELEAECKRLEANLASKTEIANQLKDGLADAFEREVNLKAERDALAAQVARLENDFRQKKLIHVGFTNESQVQYVTEQKEDGCFYPDSNNGCYIPIYMLDIHAHRVGPDSDIYKEHCERRKFHKEVAEIRAEAGRKGYAQAIFEQFAGDYQALDKLKDCADEYAAKVRQGGE